MRPIDADALKNWIDCGHLRSPTELCFSEQDVVRIIDMRPTIDAVPVVHYKDTNTTVLNVKSIEDWQDRIILDEGEESRSSAVYYADSDDMVRVVRCKDCKHWGTTDYAIAETEHVKCCAYANYMIDANGYCMYGEIKEATK